MKFSHPYKIIWLGIIGMAITCMSVFNPIGLLKEALAIYFGDGTSYEVRKSPALSTLQFLTATKVYTLEDLATDIGGGSGAFTTDGQGIELSGLQFSLELTGATLSKSASGLKVADTYDDSFLTTSTSFSGDVTGTYSATVVGNDSHSHGSGTITEADPLALLTAGTDNVKDTHIDWGTGTNQVSTTDMTEGTNLYYTSARVQAETVGGDATGTVGTIVVNDNSHAHTGTTLSGIDISSDTNLTAGDALTLTDDDIDFDGGATPAGELGGTWASPTVDSTHSGSAHHSAVTMSGTPDYITLSGQDIVRGTVDISDDTNLSVGVGLTLTGDQLTVGANQIINTMIAADEIYDSDINWGTGANQVSTDDVTEGSTNKYMVASIAAGDMIYRNDTGWAILSKGNDNDVLTMNGNYPNWEVGGGGGANTALSNLASVAINTSLISDTANTDDLGSSTIGWQDLYLDDANTTAPTTNGQINYNSTNARFEAYGNSAVTTTVPIPVADNDLLYAPAIVQESFTTVTDSDTGGAALGHSLGIYNDQTAQSFQIGSTITNIRIAQIYIVKVSTPGNITIRIETDSAGAPSGTLVNANATGTILEANVPASGAEEWIKVTFTGNFSLTASTTYWLVLKLSSDPGAGEYYIVYGSAIGGYANGLYRYHPNGGSWTDGVAITDAAFKVLSSPTIWSVFSAVNKGVLVTNSVGTPSISTDIPTAVTIGSGYIYRAGGTNIAQADTMTGTMILLNADNTGGSSAVSAALESYTLATNTYASIIVEAEGYVIGVANDDWAWDFYIRNDTVQQDLAVSLRADATGAGDVHTMAWSISANFTDTNGATVDLYANEIIDGATAYITKLYVWGVI